MEILFPLSISKDVKWKAPIMREGGNQFEGTERTFTHTAGWAGVMASVCVIALPLAIFKIKCVFFPWTIRTIRAIFSPS